MFNKNFYPTPHLVAIKMIQQFVKFSGDGTMLDPSAGKGDLLKYVKQLTKKLLAIEIEPDLRKILTDTYTVIHDDFLTYDGMRHIDGIIMNPPFDCADEHLLKAWDVIADGGQIVCLIPTGMMELDGLKEGLVKTLIANHGRIQHLGKCFANSERPTNVNVSMVYLCKAVKGGLSFDYEKTAAPETDTCETPKDIMSAEYAEALVAAFKASCNSYKGVLTEMTRTTNFMKPFTRGWGVSTRRGGEDMQTYDEFLLALQQSAWAKILNHPKMQGIMTKSVRKDFDAFREKQNDIDFTINNIRSLFQHLANSSDSIKSQVVLDAFDHMTKYYDGNRCHVEGWKSDECWRVNKRVIFPYCVDTYLPYLSQSSVQVLLDIDRAMCVAANVIMEDITTIESTANACIRKGFGNTESTFFRIKTFKKGTVHLIFKDEELLAKFNYLAAQGRGWLPPSK